MHVVKLIGRNDIELGEPVILQIGLESLKRQVMRDFRVRCSVVWCRRRSAVCRRKKELPIVFWSEVVLVAAVIRVGVRSRCAVKARQRDRPLISWSDNGGQAIRTRVIDCSRVGDEIGILLIRLPGKTNILEQAANIWQVKDIYAKIRICVVEYSEIAAAFLPNVVWL